MGEVIEFIRLRRQAATYVQAVGKGDFTSSDPHLADHFEVAFADAADEEKDAHALLIRTGFSAARVKVGDEFRVMTYVCQTAAGDFSVELYSDAAHRVVSFDACVEADTKRSWIRYLPSHGASLARATEAAVAALENWALRTQQAQALRD